MRVLSKGAAVAHISLTVVYVTGTCGGWAEREAVRLPLARIIIVLAAVAVGYFVFSAVGDALLSHRLTQDEQQLRDQIDQLSRQQKDLEGLRDYLQTNDYVRASLAASSGSSARARRCSSLARTLPRPSRPRPQATRTPRRNPGGSASSARSTIPFRGGSWVPLGGALVFHGEADRGPGFSPASR
jgi:hypothetical protein